MNTDKPQVSPEMEERIQEYIKPYFPPIPITNCTGPIDYERRNELQRHKRNCIRQGMIEVLSNPSKYYLTSQQGAAPVQGWVIERERKPPFGVPVLVYCAIYGRYIGTFERLGDTKCGNWHDGKQLGVLPPTHWMPLPALPGSAVSNISEEELRKELEAETAKYADKFGGGEYGKAYRHYLAGALRKGKTDKL